MPRLTGTLLGAEVRDFLGLAVLVDREVLFPQRVHEAPVVVGHRGRDVHQLDAAREACRLRFLPGQRGAQDSRHARPPAWWRRSGSGRAAEPGGAIGRSGPRVQKAKALPVRRCGKGPGSRPVPSTAVQIIGRDPASVPRRTAILHGRQVSGRARIRPPADRPAAPPAASYGACEAGAGLSIERRPVRVPGSITMMRPPGRSTRADSSSSAGR